MVPTANEHYYAIVRYKDGVEHESRPFDTYDEAAMAAWQEVADNPRRISRAVESYWVIKRWDVAYV